jgi:hypothetical protein
LDLPRRDVAKTLQQRFECRGTIVYRRTSASVNGISCLMGNKLFLPSTSAEAVEPLGM